MEIMFNELSLSPCENKYKTREMLETFIHAAVRASDNELFTIRWTEESYNKLKNNPLSPSYFLSQWLSDHEVNPDLREKFRQLTLTYPLLTNNMIRELQEYESSELIILINGQNKSGKGLLAAIITDSLAISFLTYSVWDTIEIQSHLHWIDHDAQFQDKPVSVRHFATRDHFNKHISWLQQNRIQSLNNGNDLWNRRNQLFPELIFCGETENQLTKQGISKSLSIIIDKLGELNKISQEWKEIDGDILSIVDHYALNISDESERTMDLYGSQRRFSFPDGTKDYFRLHIKLSSGQRIHIFPDKNKRVIYVGYIGKHLDLASEG